MTSAFSGRTLLAFALLHSVLGVAAVQCWDRVARPHVQGKRNPSKMVGAERGHQRAGRLKPKSQTTSQSDHRTTALSNTLKLSHAMWGHPGWRVHGGEV